MARLRVLEDVDARLGGGGAAGLVDDHAGEGAGGRAPGLPGLVRDAGDVTLTHRQVALVGERALGVAGGVVRGGVEAALARREEGRGRAGEERHVDRDRLGVASVLSRRRDGEVAVADVAAGGGDEVEAERLLEGVAAGVERVVDDLVGVEADAGGEDVGLVAEEDEVTGHHPAAEGGVGHVLVVAEDLAEDGDGPVVLVEGDRLRAGAGEAPLAVAFEAELAVGEPARGGRHRAAVGGGRVLEHDGAADDHVPVAGAEDVVGLEAEAGLHVGEEQAQRAGLVVEDAQRLEERSALALDADRRLGAVRPVVQHEHLGERGIGVGDEQVGHREELGEAVVPLPVLEAKAVAAHVHVDDAAAEDARPGRVLGAEDVDADLVVLEEEVADGGHGDGAAHQLAGGLHLLGEEHAIAVVAAHAGGEGAEERERNDGLHRGGSDQRLSWTWKTSESFLRETP